jgi:3'-phosphoadenosine 5'-phosphosulfate sulfotransferase (PAPS reductase)/FAD synthetase
MSDDPFIISGPGVISFSGGRTSAYMLWRIMQSNQGKLPDDLIVLFQNTGREMPATLNFIRDCSELWGIPVTWLEYDRTDSGPSYRKVNYDNASRDGEPFKKLLKAKSMLPNPVARFCTVELKIKTAKRFIVNELKWSRWKNVVGLRADEMRRVSRATDPEKNKKDKWDVVCPLADAGITVNDVHQFWKTQPFDLKLAGKWEGNCDGCFLKSRSAIHRMIQDHPDKIEWWSKQERELVHGKGVGARFRKDREDYSTMIKEVQNNKLLPFDETMIEGGQECGMECGI